MIAVGDRLSLIDDQIRDIGNVILDRIDGQLHSGRFEPLAPFASIESLFRDWMECANKQLFAHLDELDEKIEQLGLQLMTNRGEKLVGADSFQIGAGRLTFRLTNPLLNGTPQVNQMSGELQIGVKS